MSHPRFYALGLAVSFAASLAACSIPASNFHASPDGGADDQPPGADHQVIKVSATSLTVPEGSTGTFGVSLMFDPGGPVTVNLVDDNTSALPIGTTSIPFNSTNFATPVMVTATANVDSNTTSETATVTLSGAGAPTAPTIGLTATDKTVLQLWGWPDPFPTTNTVSAGFAFAYKIDVGAVANLDVFHTFVPTAVGLYRMALYTDAGNVPGTLVAQMGDGKVLVNGVNDAAPLANVQLTSPSYFLVIRFSADVNIGYAAAGTTPGRQCFRNVAYSTISDAWAPAFGASTCVSDRLFNIWISTVHQ